MLIAATDLGICSIQFAGSDGELNRRLEARVSFCHAQALRRRTASVGRSLALENDRARVECRAAFGYPRNCLSAARVDYLQSIPFGATRSYGQVAKAIGQPRASRAVARACATIQSRLRFRAIAWSEWQDQRLSLGRGEKKTLLEMEQRGL